jgi:hypothetical protein
MAGVALVLEATRIRTHSFGLARLQEHGPNFVQRNKDQLMVGAVAAVLSGAIGALLTWLVLRE